MVEGNADGAVTVAVGLVMMVVGFFLVSGLWTAAEYAVGLAGIGGVFMLLGLFFAAGGVAEVLGLE